MVAPSENSHKEELMLTLSPEEIIRKFVSEQNRHNPGGMAELVHEDYEVHAYTCGQKGELEERLPARGRSAVKQHWQYVFERYPEFSVFIIFLEYIDEEPNASLWRFSTMHLCKFGPGIPDVSIQLLINCIEEDGCYLISSTTVIILDPLPGSIGQE